MFVFLWKARNSENQRKVNLYVSESLSYLNTLTSEHLEISVRSVQIGHPFKYKGHNLLFSIVNEGSSQVLLLKFDDKSWILTLDEIIHPETAQDHKSYDFEQIAKDLFTKRMLCVETPEGKPAHLFLREVEFYLNSNEHPDDTVHCHPVQKHKDCIYFHRASTKKDAKYRGGTFKGMDLVWGDGNDYFGILIRSVETENGEVVEGPCKVVNHLLEIMGKQHIRDILTEDQSLNYCKPLSCIYLAEVKTELPMHQYMKGPRIGLPDTEWGNKLYRFVNFTKAIKKRKGLINV